MHMPFLYLASLGIVSWSQLGSEEVRENWLIAVHTGIFLPPAQHQNETDRDSSKCTKEIGNLFSVTGLLVIWGGSKGKTLERICPWKDSRSPRNGLQQQLSKDEAIREAGGVGHRIQAQADGRGPWSK